MAKTAQRKSPARVTLDASAVAGLAVSAKAEEAFADYVELGPDRSYRALAALYTKQKRYKTETTAFNQIAKWAGQYGWQKRIADAATARSAAKLEASAELDADTFLRSSRELNKRAEYSDAFKLDELVRMRETVRKPQPKGGVSVNVNVEIQQIAEKLAKDLGIEASELIAEAERIAAGAWGDA